MSPACRAPTIPISRRRILIAGILGGILSLLALFGLAVFFFWLSIQPYSLEFHATNASLSQFTLAASAAGSSMRTTTLYYDLELNMKVRNSNHHVGFHYDAIRVEVYYHGLLLDATYLSPFYQCRRQTTYVGPVRFKGQKDILDTTATGTGTGTGRSSCLISDYYREKANGSVFNVEVRIFLSMRSKLRLGQVGKFYPKIACHLKVPLLSSSGEAFVITKCTRVA
ncbi:hypothetical protein Dimus_006943 [Dionaea muscipula]